MKLESLLQYLDEYLGIPEHPDYSTALNGLQVEGPTEVTRIAAAVDASERSIEAAAEGGANLLLVHHGLFWGGLQPVTGPRFRRLKKLFDADMAVFSCHLPLDSHPEVGNCVLLADALGLSRSGRFGAYKGVELGSWGEPTEPMAPEALVARTKEVLGTDVHLIAGGPDRIDRVGVVTGGGGSFVADAVAAGLDALVTGEGSHHTHFDATELGIHVLFGGHYATETFGVKALAAHLEERFEIPWFFIDQPTGL